MGLFVRENDEAVWLESVRFVVRRKKMGKVSLKSVGLVSVKRVEPDLT